VGGKTGKVFGVILLILSTGMVAMQALSGPPAPLLAIGQATPAQPAGSAADGQ